MRFFDDACMERLKTSDTIILMTSKEGQIILEALTEYVKNNKKKTNAKKLLKEMEDWSLF